MPENAKISPLSDAAFRAYVTSICFAARNLTDGLISVRQAKEYAGRARVVQELVPHLWEPKGEASFYVHDFLVYNPTREKVEADKASAKKRMGTFARNSPEIPPKFAAASPRNSVAPVNPDPLPITPESLDLPADPNPEPDFRPPTPLAPKARREAEKVTAEYVSELQDHHPTVNVERVAVELADYVLLHPRKYIDHRAALRTWVRKREDDAKAKQPALTTPSRRYTG